MINKNNNNNNIIIMLSIPFHLVTFYCLFEKHDFVAFSQGLLHLFGAHTANLLPGESI